MPKQPNRKSKKDWQPSGKDRSEVLLEEVRSQNKLLLEGLTGLTQQIEQLEHRVNRLEQKIDLLGSSILGHSNDVQGLRRDVRSLTERFEEHIQTHATQNS